MQHLSSFAAVTFNQQQLETLLKIHDSQFRGSLHIFETLPSTNQTLWKLIDQGAPSGTVVIAEQQIAGRGQWGRQWQSPLGGLYLSIALAPDLAAASAAQLTICSAWGIATALRSYDIPVLIKWPNDLLLQGRKLGGILTETRVCKGKITSAIVGVGINWVNPVPETGINLHSFVIKPPPAQGNEGSQPHCSSVHPRRNVTSLEMLAAIAIQGILSGFQHAKPENIEALLLSYLEILSGRGRSVVVNGRSGVIVGITSTGELRVRLPSSTTDSEICLKPGTISLGYDI